MGQLARLEVALTRKLIGLQVVGALAQNRTRFDVVLEVTSIGV